MNKRRFRKFAALFHGDGRLRFAIITLSLVSLICFFAPLLGGDPNKLDVSNAFAPLSLLHPLGTDDLGRDFLLRVLCGGRVSIGVGIITMLISTAIGMAVGMFSGYTGGIVDSILMRLIDVLSSIPWMLMIIVVQLFFKRGLVSLILVIGLFGWGEIARLIRNQTLTVRQFEYVEYARLCGLPVFRILGKHVFPANTPSISAAATAAAARAIMMESTLSFLNLGIQPPQASWGSLLQSAQKYLMKAPLQALVPGLLIIAVVYSLAQIGNALSIALEPRHLEAAHAEKKDTAY